MIKLRSLLLISEKMDRFLSKVQGSQRKQETINFGPN